ASCWRTRFPGSLVCFTLSNSSDRTMSGLIIPIAAFLGIAALVGGIAMLLAPSTASGVEDRLTMLTGSSTGKQAKDALLKASVLSQPLEGSRNMLAEYFS